MTIDQKSRLKLLLQEALVILTHNEEGEYDPPPDSRPPLPNREPDLTLQWKTFDEWSNDGYRIIKGQKATRINGINKFSSEQVTTTNKPKPLAAASENYHEADPHQFDDEDAPF